jgi:hypothetical protein
MKKIINNLSLEKSWEKNRMMYGKNREINNLSLVWMMISHPYHHTTYWFLSFACVYFILYGPGLQHMEIHPAAKKYKPNGVWTHDHGHLQTTPKPLHHLPSFGFDLSDIFSICQLMFSRPKNTSQTGFEPMITGSYRPHPNHYTTRPVLVLTCLIFSLYANWCFLRPFNLAQKKRDDGGGFELGTKDPTLEPLTTAPLT